MLNKFSTRIPRVKAEALEIPFRRDTFDVVFEANLVHHIDNDELLVDKR